MRGATGEPASLAAVPVGGDDTAASQISHIIYRGHFSRCPKNVAIPTTQMQCLNESSRNYVRNCWLAAIAGHQGNAPSNISREGPTGVKGAGGTRRPGCGVRGRWRRLTDNTLTTSTARLEAAAGPAGPGRASRRRAERSSQRGRRAGGQATRRPEIWRGIATPEIRRAAAHGQTKQPGPTAGPSDARNTSGTTSTSNTTRPRVCGNPSPHMQETPPRRCGTGFSLPSRV